MFLTLSDTMLTYSHPNGRDEQWCYTDAVALVRKNGRNVLLFGRGGIPLMSIPI